MKITSAMIPLSSVSEQIVAAAIASTKKKAVIAIETTVESVAGTTSYTSVGSTAAYVEGPIVASPDANLYDRLGTITQKMSTQVNQLMNIMEPMTAQVEQAQVTTLDITV